MMRVASWVEGDSLLRGTARKCDVLILLSLTTNADLLMHGSRCPNAVDGVLRAHEWRDRRWPKGFSSQIYWAE